MNSPIPPLSGLLILDFSRLIAGPSATDILASFGARVIKVESLDGDPMRLTRSKTAGSGPTSPTFAAYNTLKESVALNLKDPEDLEKVYALVREADAVVESFRPGVMNRLGLGADRLTQIKPDLVYASLSAFSPHSPEAGRGGVDIVMQAETGLMSVTGEPDRVPLKSGTPIVDAASAYVLALGVVTALLGRERFAQGDTVAVSMFDVGVHLQAQQFAEFLASGIEPQRVGNRAPYAAPADVFTAADGDIVISAHIPEHWRRFSVALGHPEWQNDPRFVDVAQRVQHRAELNAEIAEVLATEPVDYWLGLLQSTGIAAGRVASYANVVNRRDSPVLAAKNVDGSEIRIIAPPLRVESATGLVRERKVPDLNEHADRVFGAISGKAAVHSGR